ncbi:Flavocytochrome c [Neocallimastix lanati (nom. inval.)]|jgi:flavocytochrome c|nr:Flavocytochrome c [Neocallimastix sp. JGI-2020a]
MENRPKIIVVGGGLAGLSAAHTVLERGASVIVLEKNAFLGGNSTKATSGINGALTKTQIKLGIMDSVDAFYKDSADSAKHLLIPELTKVLTWESASAVEWLSEKFKIDLSLVSRLGGHTFPRTHRGSERFPGMTITYTLLEALENIAKTQPYRAKILKKANVRRLLKNEETGAVIGVEFEMNGETLQEFGPVIIATGGFAADFTENSLIKAYRPDIYHLPSTNAQTTTGDGIKMARDIGAELIHMDMVQVHPTGLVDPRDPDAKWKFLAAEALRGVGGILIDRHGKRFCNELGYRDYVTDRMWNSKGPFRLVLNSKAAKELVWHVKHYMGRGLMKKFKNGAELAAEMNIEPEKLEKQFNKYNRNIETKTDKFGKKFFPNGPFVMDDEYYVAIVCPVLHFTMGGVKISPQAEVLNKEGPIPGLFAAGELCGGVHGANRLGGSSLLACVVFGRVSGATASSYLLNDISNTISNLPKEAEKEAEKEPVEVQPSMKITLELYGTGEPVTTEVKVPLNGQSNAIETTTTKRTETSNEAKTLPKGHPGHIPITKKDKKEEGETKKDTNKASSNEPKPNRDRLISVEEVSKHNTEDDCWVIINGNVLNMTHFLNEHPGGKNAILLYAGKDASNEFNMIHQFDVIEKYAPDTIIGKVANGTSKL